jgi:hypothetical protein
MALAARIEDLLSNISYNTSALRYLDSQQSLTDLSIQSMQQVTAEDHGLQFGIILRNLLEN